jgi:hypothetical protein
LAVFESVEKSEEAVKMGTGVGKPFTIAVSTDGVALEGVPSYGEEAPTHYLVQYVSPKSGTASFCERFKTLSGGLAYLVGNSPGVEFTEAGRRFLGESAEAVMERAKIEGQDVGSYPPPSYP